MREAASLRELRVRALGPGILCAALLLGCGGGGGQTPGGSRSYGGSGSAASGAGYRWLVPTEGEAGTIAHENEQPGTTSWRLPGPADLLGGAAHGPVAGYVAEQAVAPGEEQRIYVDAPGARTVTIGVYRMGWYGGAGGRLVLQSAPLRSVSQPPCTHRYLTGLTECRWRATLSFAIPPALVSGVYIAKLTTSRGAQSDCLFVVRARRPAPLLVEIPTATYEAYNAWGGDSLYPGGSKIVGATGTSQGVEVSYDRPYESQTGAGQFFIREVAIVRFLERYGYPVSYTTIDSIDREPGQLTGVRALIDAGHSEYWSEGDAQALARARDAGTSLVFISSDTMAWRVRFAPAGGASSQAGEPDHTIVAYKEHAARDPDRSTPSGPFPLGGADLVGSAYNGCVTPRVVQPGPPVYRYYSWAPSPHLQPSWLFAGTGITASTRIPGVVGYELDERTAATPQGTLPRGRGRRGVHAIGRAGARSRVGGGDHALHGELGSARVRHRHARLALRALTRSPGLARCAGGPRPARGRDDAQPARARARALRLVPPGAGYFGARA